MAKLDHNGLLVILQHEPTVLLRSLNLFISVLLGSQLTFSYILVLSRRRLPTKNQWLQWHQTSLVPNSDGGRTSAARQRRALSIFPELKVANFALLLSVRRTENGINIYYKRWEWQCVSCCIG